MSFRYASVATLCCMAASWNVLSNVEALPQSSSIPREQLQQYVAQLKDDPGNQNLRERIIKLALTLKPAPAIPDEAAELVGAGKYTMKHATTRSDFAEVVKKLQEALAIAPWVADIYYNLGVAQQSAEQFDDAVKSYRLYLLAAPDATDREAVLERIGAAKAAGENPPTKVAQAQTSADVSPSPPRQLTREEQQQQLVDGLDGACFLGPDGFNGFMIERGSLWGIGAVGIKTAHPHWEREIACRLNGLSCTETYGDGGVYTNTVSDDGKSIDRAGHEHGRDYRNTYVRARNCPVRF